MSKPPTEIRTEIMDMTPELAAAVLANNGHNRSLTRNRVEQLAGAMSRGEFIGLNGETIKLDAAGSLQDGQHRLAAVAKSGTTQKMMVVRGVPEGAQETIDTGRARGLRDILTIRGEPNADKIAAAIGMVYAYEVRGVPDLSATPLPRPTMQQLLATLDRHPGIRDSVHAGGNLRKLLLLGRSSVIGLHYLFASADQEDADEFFLRLSSGDNLETGDPIYALRDRFVRSLSQTEQLPSIVVLAFTIRAFNAWRAGETVLKYQWKPGGAKPDRFPAIRDCQIERLDQ